MQVLLLGDIEIDVIERLETEIDQILTFSQSGKWPYFLP